MATRRYTRADYIREQRDADQRARVIESEENRQLRRIAAQDRRANSPAVLQRQAEEERRIRGSANPYALGPQGRVSSILANSSPQDSTAPTTPAGTSRYARAARTVQDRRAAVDRTAEAAADAWESRHNAALARGAQPEPMDAFTAKYGVGSGAIDASSRDARDAVADMWNTVTRNAQDSSFRPAPPQGLFAPQPQNEEQSLFTDSVSQLSTSLDRSVQRLNSLLGTSITPRLDGTAVNPVASPSMGFTGPTTMGITSGQPALPAFRPSIGVTRPTSAGAFTWGGR